MSDPRVARPHRTGSMRISEWLTRSVAYDGIHHSHDLKRDFKARTGYTAPDWREEPLARAMEDSLQVWPHPGVPRETVVCFGIDVARAIERAFVPGLRPESEHFIGRGRNF